jgi:uncharacterized membrane protein SpoIIM required for sporulation
MGSSPENGGKSNFGLAIARLNWEGLWLLGGLVLCVWGIWCSWFNGVVFGCFGGVGNCSV